MQYPRFARLLLLTALASTITASARAKHYEILSPEEADDRKLDEDCDEQTRQAKKDFYREKKLIEKSLRSLDDKANQRASRLRQAQKKFSERIADIDHWCRQERKRIEKTRRRNNKRPSPSEKPRPAPTETPRPQPPVRTIPLERPVPPAKPAPRVVSEPGPAWIEDFNMHGLLSQQVAFRLNEPRIFRKNRFQAVLEQNATLLGSLKLHLSERSFIDTVPTHENQSVPEGQPLNTLAEETRLREAFVDTTLGPVDARIGKQNVVWGEATSLFVADVVNGKDLRETILPDFDWIRQPQWSGDFSWITNMLTTEALVSLPEFHRYASPGSDFAYELPSPIADIAEPAANLRNSETGARFSRLFGALDLSTFYIYTWDKFRPLGRTVGPTGVVFTPTNYRQSVWGATFSDAVGDTIFRGEYTVRPKTLIPTTNPLDADGLVRKTSTDYLLSADRTFGPIQIDAQIIQRFISAWDPNEALVGERKTQTHLALWAKWDLTSIRLEPQVLWIVGVAQSDWLLRPKLKIQVSDDILFNVGADIFGGDAKPGLFSPFQSQSRAYADWEFHF